MSLWAKPRTDTAALSTTLATTILAVPASGIDRYIKHIKIINTAAATTYTIGLHTTTVAPAAADPGIFAFARPIAANAEDNIYFTGDGYKWVNAGTLNFNGGIAAGTGSIAIVSNEVVA